MASINSGMANGTNKPGYMNSFMSFLENKDDGDPDDPGILQNQSSGEEMEIKKEIKEEEEEEDPISFDHPSIENQDVTEAEIKVEVSEEIASSDFVSTEVPVTDGESTNSSEATSLSEAGSGSRGEKRNVAKRGRGKKGAGNADAAPQRESLRRTSRPVKRYSPADESDGMADSDPDYHLSDSDDDPDFNPADKKGGGGSDEEELSAQAPRRGRGRGRGGSTRGAFSSVGRGRGVKRPLTKENSTSPSKTNKSPATSSAPKRRGRPPSYKPIVPREPSATTTTTTNAEGGESEANNSSGHSGTVIMLNVRKGPAQLSSAYNYAAGQAQRQNQNIRLPEGPELTQEQLEMVESKFKSGDFVMLRSDQSTIKNPPIWRIDGKSLLQKFQAFEKGGKTLYRNISTYSGWTSQAKALYLGVKVTFVFQSRYDTVVQMIGFKPEGGDDEEDDDDEEEENDDDEEIDEGAEAKRDQTFMNWLKGQPTDMEIPEELRAHMTSFEIYLQTLISQALDNNFLMEIYQENDEYFVERVKLIDDLAEQRAKKILENVKWNDKFKKSLDTWPCVNVMIRTNKNEESCEACSNVSAKKLLQLYGQPYSQQTLRYNEPSNTENEEKNFSVCETCANVSQLYNKVTHQKYDYYSQCKAKVTNMRVADAKKATTDILQDLLANDHWITKLFRSMCTTWIKVDRLFEEDTTTTTSSRVRDDGREEGEIVEDPISTESDPDDPEATS